MKTRFNLFRRDNGVFYTEDTTKRSVRRISFLMLNLILSKVERQKNQIG